MFWATKAVSTALGEAASDFSIHVMPPVVAVLCGFAAFVVALVIQLGRRRYTPWAYWLTVAMVGVFGTMAADVVHVAFGVPYPLSTLFYALVLAAVFVLWRRTEGTLSVHEVTTTRRELFYWAAVVATFAMGTALGDFTAYGLGLGYVASIALFAVLILVPAIGYRFWRWNAVFSFWFAYVVTRPLGASVADWLAKPEAVGGLGLGGGWVTLAFAAVMVVLVGLMYLPVSRRRLSDDLV
ncbi:membrane protein [Microbacterium mangrovi]|uniref:Membrane protein n=1 Tax=Microbacterium mangrovi TaxID=1348253 RepID=A0A0B2A7W8_9MICO|nr:membrane protein [Microbacterium mangrovi]